MCVSVNWYSSIFLVTRMGVDSNQIGPVSELRFSRKEPGKGGRGQPPLRRRD